MCTIKFPKQMESDTDFNNVKDNGVLNTTL